MVPFNEMENTFYIMKNLKNIVLYTKLISNCRCTKLETLHAKIGKSWVISIEIGAGDMTLDGISVYRSGNREYPTKDPQKDASVSPEIIQHMTFYSLFQLLLLNT